MNCRNTRKFPNEHFNNSLYLSLKWIVSFFHFRNHKNFKSKFHKVLDKHRWNLYWIKKCTLMNCLRDVKLKLSSTCSWCCLLKLSFRTFSFVLLLRWWCWGWIERWGKWKMFQLRTFSTIFTCSILYERGDFMFVWKLDNIENRRLRFVSFKLKENSNWIDWKLNI